MQQTPPQPPMIDPMGQPTPEFCRMVETTIKMWIGYEKNQQVKTEFVVMSAQDKEGRISYWGVIDVPATPQEDLFVEIERRFYCAYRTIGQFDVVAVGILDINAVINRRTMPPPIFN